MGGKVWSDEEEQTFWTEVVPTSTKRYLLTKPHHDDSRGWEGLCHVMQHAMGRRARRRYTALMLYEHYFQNSVLERFSPNASPYVQEYINNERLATGHAPSERSRSAMRFAQHSIGSGRRPRYVVHSRISNSDANDGANQNSSSSSNGCIDRNPLNAETMPTARRQRRPRTRRTANNSSGDFGGEMSTGNMAGMVQLPLRPGPQQPQQIPHPQQHQQLHPLFHQPLHQPLHHMRPSPSPPLLPLPSTQSLSPPSHYRGGDASLSSLPSPSFCEPYYCDRLDSGSMMSSALEPLPQASSSMPSLMPFPPPPMLLAPPSGLLPPDMDFLDACQPDPCVRVKQEDEHQRQQANCSQFGHAAAPSAGIGLAEPATTTLAPLLRVLEPPPWIKPERPDDHSEVGDEKRSMLLSSSMDPRPTLPRPTALLSSIPHQMAPMPWLTHTGVEKSGTDGEERPWYE